jgi:hypothetical protein
VMSRVMGSSGSARFIADSDNQTRWSWDWVWGLTPPAPRRRPLKCLGPS